MKTEYTRRWDTSCPTSLSIGQRGRINEGWDHSKTSAKSGVKKKSRLNSYDSPNIVLIRQYSLSAAVSLVKLFIVYVLPVSAILRHFTSFGSSKYS